MENNNDNLYVPTETPKGPNGLKVFWQNLNPRQRNVFIVGSIVIVILLVVGFVVSMNAVKETGEIADDETTAEGVDGSSNGEGSSGGTSSGDNGDEGSGNEGGESDELIDPTSTPIEGGDQSNISTYLPHGVQVEIAPELTADGILDYKYMIYADKDSKVITIEVYDLNDVATRAEAEAYLASIPGAAKDGYSVKTIEIYGEEE